MSYLSNIVECLQFLYSRPKYQLKYQASLLKLYQINK